MMHHRLVAILAAALPIAAGCNAILGADNHTLKSGTGGTSGAAGSAGTGGVTGTGGSVVGPSCTDGSVTDGDVCGFLMPNPASAPGNLPNRASYMRSGATNVKDNITGLTWEANVDQTVHRWDEAIAYCQNKGPGWRLPSRLELVTLVDFTIARPGPTLAPAYFGSESVWSAVPDMPNNYRKFWTSSHAAYTTTMAWEVDFSDGSTHQRPSTDYYKARCVYGAPCRCAPTHFTVQGAQQDEVYDGITGLTWQRGYQGTMVWTDATAFCPANWRLPTPGELATIVDETTEMPSIYQPTFPSDTPGEPFWTSFPQAGSADGGVPTYAWFVTFFHGHSDVYPSSDPNCTGDIDGGNCYKMWVKCVR